MQCCGSGPDSHQNDKQAPDPHPDLHQSDKQDPDPHQSDADHIGCVRLHNLNIATIAGSYMRLSYICAAEMWINCSKKPLNP
jgi:hypothetical protein